MSLFIPLRKVDASQKLVFGQIDEAPDRAGEVFDYDSSKPYFIAWSAAMHKASEGKSYGNIRAMHGQVAAGKLEDISFDDATKRIQLCARIVDDDEWSKVMSGVYTGFSPGGRYVAKWADGALTRYTAEPAEISIVDLPCIPSASFTLVKADGAEEQVAFKANGRMLGKIGARNRQADLALIQSMHDAAVSLGAHCCDDGDADEALLAAAPAVDWRKIADERDVLRKRVAELEALPQPGGAVLKAVAKGQDLAESAEIEELSKINAMPDGLAKSLALIKLAHRYPQMGQY